jgi:MFS family permease
MNPSRLLAPVRDVLGNGAMARVQAAWLLAIAAEWAYLVALLVFAYGVGGVAAAGLIATLRMLPPVIGAPLATTLADRFPTPAVLAGVNAMRAIVILATAAILVVDGPPALVFVAAMVEGLLAVVKRPATLSLLPGLARTPEELVAGNAVMSSGEALGMLVGPAAASLMLGLAGLGVALAVPAIALLAAAALTVTLHAASHRVGARRGTLHELAGGFQALRHHSTSGLVIGLFSAQTFVRGLLTVLLVAASVELLGFGEGGVGWLNSAIGAGGLIGAAAATVWMVGGRLGPGFTLALAVWGLPIAVVGIVPVGWLAIVLMAIVGIANAALDVAGLTLIQRSVPNALRARVFGSFEGIAALTFALGSLAAAPLVEVVGLRLALVVTGAILPLLALVSAPAVRRADATAIVPRRELDLLRRDPLFAPLSLVVLEQLAQSMSVERAGAGTALVAQGEVGDAYRLLADGTADVVRDGRILRSLGPGDGFGEIALLEDRPRTASVVATTVIELYQLPRGAFLDAVAGTPASARAADRLVGDRLARLDA